jgi:hypothetical protein
LSRDEGASAVEFALIVPALTLLIFGIISFGIIFAQQISLGNAARQAARAGAVSGPICGSSGSPGTGLIGQAQTDATTIAVNPSNVVVTIRRQAPAPALPTNPCGSSGNKPCDGSSAGDNLLVTTQYTSQMLTPFVQPSFNLTATGVFRCEFS